MRFSKQTDYPNEDITRTLEGFLTRTLEEFPDTVIGDFWYCMNQFPNQLIDDCAFEFWFRNQRYCIGVHRVDESMYEDEES